MSQFLMAYLCFSLDSNAHSATCLLAHVFSLLLPLPIPIAARTMAKTYFAASAGYPSYFM